MGIYSTSYKKVFFKTLENNPLKSKENGKEKYK
jgi:hypothetical protein